MKGLVLGAALLALAAGCSHNSHHGSHPAHETRTGVAHLFTNVKGLEGRIDFIEEDGHMTVMTFVDGLSKGPHGFHIHEIGDCSKGDFTSAGGHFNPAKVSHGSLHAAENHAGDLGNLVAGMDEKAYSTIITHGITLGEGKNSIVGKAIIIHKDADDYVTQPTGNSGGRIACGIIELNK